MDDIKSTSFTMFFPPTYTILWKSSLLNTKKKKKIAQILLFVTYFTHWKQEAEMHFTKSSVILVFLFGNNSATQFAMDSLNSNVWPLKRKWQCLLWWKCQFLKDLATMFEVSEFVEAGTARAKKNCITCKKAEEVEWLLVAKTAHHIHA